MTDKDGKQKQKEPIKAAPTHETEYELTPEESTLGRKIAQFYAIEEEDEEKTFKKIDERIMQEAEKIRQEREKDGTQKEDTEPAESKQSDKQWAERRQEERQDRDKDDDQITRR